MHRIILTLITAMILLPSAACNTGALGGSGAGTAPGRVPCITDLYEQATRRQVHAFRKPVRDRQARARRELQAECDRWLADLQAEALPAALTGQADVQPIPPSAYVSDLQFSLEQLRSAAGQANLAVLRTAHAQTLAAYRQVEASRVR